MTTYSHAHTLVVRFYGKAVFSCIEKRRFSTEKYCISTEKKKHYGEVCNNHKKVFEKSLEKVNIDYDKSPWMTQGISKSVEIHNRLYKKFLKNRNERNNNIYKKYKNKLNHLIKIEKKDYFENQLIKYKNNVKMTWRTINQVLHRNKSKGRLPDTFREKNKDVSFSDPVVIVNRFNEYFESVGPNLAKKNSKR